MWVDAQIEERASILADEAQGVWPYPHVDLQIVESYKPKKTSRARGSWTMEDHPAFLGGGKRFDLFSSLEERIDESHSNCECYATKYYVGFRSGSRKLHLALIERTGGKGRIALCLPKSVDDLYDPKGLCEDKRQATGIGPSCPTYVNYAMDSNLDDIVALIDQR